MPSSRDGIEYEISIDPWTAGRARKLERKAGPIVIKVRSYTWADQ